MREQIKVRHKYTRKMMSFKFDFGDSIEDAIEKFGSNSVFKRYTIGAKTSARNRIFKLMKRVTTQGEYLDESEIKVAMAAWTPKTPEEVKGAFNISELRKEYDNATPKKKKEIRKALEEAMKLEE